MRMDSLLVTLGLLAAVLVPSAQAADGAILGKGIEVAKFATGGTGTRLDPWTGWDGAINALPENTVVHFQAGYYTPAGKLSLKSGRTVEGDGWASVINGAVPDDVLYARGASNLTIRNLQIDATGQRGSDAHGIHLIDGDNILIDGVWVHHAANDGIRLGPSGDNTGAVSAARIVNCLIERNGAAGPSGQGIGATDFREIVVGNNIIRHNAQNGMDLEATATPATKNVNLRVSVTGNMIHDNAGSGINLYSTIADRSKGDTTINGNTIVGNAGGYAVQLYGQLGTAVTGNTLGVSLVGVYVYNGSRYTTITGNTIRNMSDAGVRIDGAGAQHTAIMGNVIHNCGHGVRGTDGADFVTIAGNQFSDNSTNIAGFGPHTTISGGK